MQTRWIDNIKQDIEIQVENLSLGQRVGIVKLNHLAKYLGKKESSFRLNSFEFHFIFDHIQTHIQLTYYATWPLWAPAHKFINL